MGDYGPFIMGAYGVSAAVLTGLAIAIWRDMRRQKALLDALEARSAPRRRAGPGGAPGAGVAERQR